MFIKQKKSVRRKKRISYRVKSKNKYDLLRVKFHVTLRYLYVQLIDDVLGKTLLSSSSLELSLREKIDKKGTTFKSKECAVFLAESFSQKITNKQKVRGFVFDRGGKPYTGKVQSFVESLRDRGVKI